MSPSGKSAKRQRSTDVNQDAKTARSKRLKTEVVTHKGDVVVASSDKQKTDKKASKWSFDLMFRGEIYNIDPVFSVDEKYLFLSRGDAVQVYSMSTNRPVKTLVMKDSSNVTGLQLVPSDPQHLYISTLSGKLTQWNWDTGREVNNRAAFTKVSLYEVVPVKIQEKEGEQQRVAYFAVKTKGSRYIIVVNTDWTLRKDSADTVILDNSTAITHLRVLHGGQVIIACTRQQLLIGTLTTKSKEKGQYKDYEWQEFRLPVKQITSLDAREGQTSTSEEGQNKTAPVDIAISDASGVILVYNDVLSSTTRENGGLPLLQRLHWHREAVASLRWSRDGNYIISGGKESVLVFWQLDSGRRNYLPHLSSSIRSITISPVGALYAVQLADRSITVISATELNSIATIDGLQLPSSVEASVDRNARSLDGKFPVILHPREPELLLIASPGGDLQSLSFLQTFNIQTGVHISRQALARTNVTILNKGPEGTPILPPNVEMMELSENGEWLATIDSWSPPQHDVEASLAPILPGSSQSRNRSEIFLKFWHWSETQELWELATRVESPYQAPSGEAVKILSLKSRPDRSEFVTLGADNTLKVWRPSARNTGSIKVQRRLDSIEHTWKNHISVDLTGYAGHEFPGGTMSFSEDGSILAVCMKNTVHLIDTRQWTVYSSRQIFSIDSIHSVDFQGRYLVVLSEQSLAVWNVVDDVLQTPVKSASTSHSSSKNIGLAVDNSTDTFAVVSMSKGANSSNRKSTYGISVYSTSTLTLISNSVLDKPLIKFLADPNIGGYIAIDAAANLWRLGREKQNIQALALPTAAVVEGSEKRAVSGFDDIFGRVGQKTLEVGPSLSQPTASTLNLQTLGGIFDRAPPFALPPATALFKDVINSLVSSS